MDKCDAGLLIIHLRRTVRNFALYEAVSTGACTTSELAARMGVSAASLQVKLLRARDAAKKELAGIALHEAVPEEEPQPDSLD